MNTQMGSALPTEKLDRNSFTSWEYKMHQYLVGQGYWSYILTPMTKNRLIAIVASLYSSHSKIKEEEEEST